MMRIIIVGVHNKVGLPPLCSSTKSGRLIDRISEQLSKPIEKTNLFNCEYMPTKSERQELADEWYWTHLPTDDDVVVLLGGQVQKDFNHDVKNLIKLQHPAAQWSRKSMDEYVSSAVAKIENITHNDSPYPLAVHALVVGR